jgi:hypothetical protein
MKVKGSQAGWDFWLGWVVASSVGILVGFIIGMVIGTLPDDKIEWLIGLVAGIMLGIGVGVLQWLVLRRRASGVGWWVLASAAAGYAFGTGFIGILESLTALSFGTLLRYTVVAALGGAVAGILQWLVLRGKVSRAGWWVLASTVGWGLCMAVAGAGLALLEYMNMSEGFGGLLLLPVTGVVLGAVTGGALVWLLRQPVPEA